MNVNMAIKLHTECTYAKPIEKTDKKPELLRKAPNLEFRQQY